MNLNNIKPCKGSTHNSKRLGRGQGSGKGVAGAALRISHFFVAEQPVRIRFLSRLSVFVIMSHGERIREALARMIEILTGHPGRKFLASVRAR